MVDRRPTSIVGINESDQMHELGFAIKRLMALVKHNIYIWANNLPNVIRKEAEDRKRQAEEIESQQEHSCAAADSAVTPPLTSPA